MWPIEQTETFEEWYFSLDDINRENVLAALLMLQERGPMLPRPHADTVNGSQYRNMKELRIQSQGQPLRAFFAFDPQRTGVLLCAGNKSGNKRFYDDMIPVADREYAAHLESLK
ncbi:MULTISPECIES: type II toxin-antitoxin system RelE/ParE family toxin [Chromohalobacter]|uniref:Type II toxin-antitoxin system RelE/ParE family toxin n=1 Tax=Chromohalobacter canadensis TaxID=141389 RepID=A0ABZ0Y8X5_9GAMM|nr:MULTISPECIES: type II toxin-antitoxin system RelE/ParE family toxin [Chromohalobacter]MCK0767952.1 type II toxin-antitoxin system RelE/ParE family toxin [Chromohalobacter canadensis]MDV6319598.1 type II toxin-antitoxin system RelE/ParE family toxin [Chromohalobacter sp. HP20-39]WQH08520.1 type II toxin-antitoxin system RelE/ParE family toxin [Chromohalobacter canadensis]